VEQSLSSQSLAALDALAHIGHSTSVPLFTQLLAGSDLRVKRAAIEGLARAGESVSVLARAGSPLAERAREAGLRCVPLPGGPTALLARQRRT